MKDGSVCETGKGSSKKVDKQGGRVICLCDERGRFARKLGDKDFACFAKNRDSFREEWHGFSRRAAEDVLHE